jgi:hypothetical protein
LQLTFNYTVFAMVADADAHHCWLREHQRVDKQAHLTAQVGRALQLVKLVEQTSRDQRERAKCFDIDALPTTEVVFLANKFLRNVTKFTRKGF